MPISTSHALNERGQSKIPALLAIPVALLLLAVAFHQGIASLLFIWGEREEYSFGYMVPFVAAYLAWQRREQVIGISRDGAWYGVVLVVAGLALAAIGSIGMIATFQQYGFLVALFGLCLAFLGRAGFSRLAGPLAVLVFMVPLPAFFLGDLSQWLQLLSSQIGVAMIRIFGISVFLEGNVIDLGTLRLQVVEACSGLRYLFPLLTLAFISTCLFRMALWKRVVVIVSAIPITVLMNSARIAVIALLAQSFGRSMAEGFLHDFEGWLVFLVCMVILLGEIALLARIGRDKTTLAGMLAGPGETSGHVSPSAGMTVPAAFLVACGILAVGAALVVVMPPREVVKPARATFSDFPEQLGAWSGRSQRLGSDYLSILQLDDYLMANYVAAPEDGLINLYVTYYNSQVQGGSVHSPRACIPGDGWEILDIRPYRLNSVSFAGKPLEISRALIQKGGERRVAYYWFQQRGRIITGEYAVKLYILLDAIRQNRTDGAMVRLMTEVEPGSGEEKADEKLEKFAALAMPSLEHFIPGAEAH